MEKLKIKVCGMLDPQNIAGIAALMPDYMGFIFYEKSPRFAGNLNPDALNVLQASTARVGVFVNASTEYILEQAKRFSLDFIQLHGSESPEQCKELQKKIPVIKAFGIADEADLTATGNYEGVCDYFLFDTKTGQHGGSGKKFDHSILTGYKNTTPFFISGGIGPEDAGNIANIRYPLCFGVDINSRFELQPGIKNVTSVGSFIQTIRKQ